MKTLFHGLCAVALGLTLTACTEGGNERLGERPGDRTPSASPPSTTAPSGSPSTTTTPGGSGTTSPSGSGAGSSTGSGATGSGTK
jgi:hypothetical protein